MRQTRACWPAPAVRCGRGFSLQEEVIHSLSEALVGWNQRITDPVLSYRRDTHSTQSCSNTHKQTHTAADMMHLAYLLLIIFTGKNLCCEHSWWCSCVWRLTLGHYFWLCLRTWSLCLLFCCLLSQSNDAKLKPKMVKVKSQSQNIIGLPALNSFIVLIIVLHLKEEAFLLSGHLWSDKCTEKSILLRVNQLWI